MEKDQISDLLTTWGMTVYPTKHEKMVFASTTEGVSKAKRCALEIRSMYPQLTAAVEKLDDTETLLTVYRKGDNIDGPE